MLHFHATLSVTEKVQSALIDSQKNPDVKKNPDVAPPDIDILMQPAKMFIMMGSATMEDLCSRLIRSTSLEKAELYYPHLFGFIPGGNKLLIVLRHYFPSLLYIS